MKLRIETVTGGAALPYVPTLARLRSEIFCEWPYLYRGEVEDEARYLRHYTEDAASAIILARDGDTIVGAATAQPMTATHGPVRMAFQRAGRKPADYCYFGESVLLKAYRGQGAGVAFFAAREAHARRLELPFATFCAVIRNINDPRKPAGYTPLDPFWNRRGYTHHPELSCVFNWREIGDETETPHSLSFWIKTL